MVTEADISLLVGVTSVYLFLGLVIFAAIHDLAELTIPNWLILFCTALYVPAAASYQIGWVATGLGFATMFGLLVCTFILFSLRIIGGGDAKLFAVMGLWFGWSEELYVFLIYTALAGGALSIALLALHRIPLPVWMYRLKGIPQFGAQRPGIPYGIAICFGAMLAFRETVWFTGL